MKHLQRTLIGIFAIAIAHASAAELKYSVVPNFFDKAPDNQQLGPCHGGAVIDKAGNIYVTTDTARGIVVFSPEGKFVRAFGPVKILNGRPRSSTPLLMLFGVFNASRMALGLVPARSNPLPAASLPNFAYAIPRRG